MDYEIFTDSSANLTDDIIDKYRINIVSLVFYVDDTQYISYEKGKKTELQKYYVMLREKKHIRTACSNSEDFCRAFEEKLKEGKDVLYLGFSSGLSATYQSSRLAVDELKDKYPNNKIIAIDTLAGSLGEGLLVYYAAKMKSEGKSIDEVAKWVEENKLHLCHWFTVDTLFFLHRGGRVSKTSYIIGTLASIKPVLHVDNNGKLVPVSKVIGRKKSILALAEKLDKTIIDRENSVVYISHGDCIEDALFLQEKIKERVNVAEFVINQIDPVIGSHSGPGTLALFYLGTER